MTEKLPEVRSEPRGRALGEPIPTTQRARGRPGQGAFRDFLRKLVVYEELHPVIEEREVRYAATGAVASLASAGIATVLPKSASIAKGSFDIFGLVEQEITVAGNLLEDLVRSIQAGFWPLIVVGILGLLVDAYFAVRPRQPIAWHYFCAAQMLVGFLSGLVVAAIFGVLLANIATGLFVAFIVVVLGALVVGIAGLILGAIARS